MTIPQKATVICASITFFSGLSLNAAVSYSFWAYDQYAGAAQFYSHYQIGTTAEINGDATLAIIDLNIGNPYVYTVIDSGTSDGNVLSASRSVGWHHFEFEFDQDTTTATILLDGNTIQSSSYGQDPAFFRFVLHDFFGGSQETVIDDFEYRIDGSLIYQNGFESSTLDSNWIVTRQDPGTYLTSGDMSFAHTGTGGLALGSTTNDNVAAIITFVPEPSTAVLLGLMPLGLVLRRKR
jgi:hypothetical protein